MSKSGFSDILGVLLTDRESKIAFSMGVGVDPRIKALAADRGWMASARQHRLTSLTLDRKSYAILTCPMHEGDLMIISNPPGEAVTNFLGSVDFAWDLMEHLLTDPFEGMVIVDDQARIAYISAVHERFFGYRQGEVTGRRFQDVIDGTRLHHVVRTGKAEIGTMQRMRGSERIVSRIPSSVMGKSSALSDASCSKDPSRLRPLTNELGSRGRG